VYRAMLVRTPKKSNNPSAVSGRANPNQPSFVVVLRCFTRSSRVGGNLKKWAESILESSSFHKAF
jgi:hypothetical protein